MRDYATIEQLLVLANLESINAVYISKGVSPKERIVELNRIARSQLSVIMSHHGVKSLKSPRKINEK